MNRRTLAFVVGGLGVAFALAILVSPFASSSPDGLEKVATEEGFIDQAEEHGLAHSPVADYGVDGVGNDTVSTGLAGLIGVAITFAVGMVVFSVLKAGRRRRATTDTA